jgi:hypothetical protein
MANGRTPADPAGPGLFEAVRWSCWGRRVSTWELCYGLVEDGWGLTTNLLDTLKNAGARGAVQGGAPAVADARRGSRQLHLRVGRSCQPAMRRLFGADPQVVNLPPGKKLYRVIGSDKSADGGFWSTDPPPATEGQWRANSAMLDEWNGDGVRTVHGRIGRAERLGGSDRTSLSIENVSSYRSLLQMALRDRDPTGLRHAASKFSVVPRYVNDYNYSMVQRGCGFTASARGNEPGGGSYYPFDPQLRNGKPGTGAQSVGGPLTDGEPAASDR